MAMPPFPEPLVINGRNYWKRGGLRAFDDACAGQKFDATPRPDDEHLLTTNQVRQRYGDISSMTVWRWRHAKPKAA
jgi:hypothetical protein